MRNLLCTICLILALLVSGCATYYYQPGKTLEQCFEDSKECVRTAHLHQQCMTAKGYQKLHTIKHLPTETKTRRIYVTILFGFTYAAGSLGEPSPSEVHFELAPEGLPVLHRH